ncbi:MAG: RNA-directed DNA polymerase [Oscillospiraceae bacterium]|nr:RNA-directed DNA polymerase [Oscillospiraceae bacterium]
MGVFDKMLSDTYKQAFIRKKMAQLGTEQSYLDALSEYVTSSACDEDVLRLKNGDYFLNAPTRFFVRKSHSTKRRKVYSFKGKDKFLLQYITFVLMDLDDIHVDSLCSFRRDNRTEFFFEKLRRKDLHRKLYVMKTDIHDFGGSVDQDIALRLLEEVFRDDPAFMAFLRQLLTRNAFYSRGELVEERVSIIEGLPLGSFIQSVYLAELDRILEANAVIYMRYTDDIAFFTDSPEKAEWALAQVKEICGKRAVTINEDKTEIIPPGEPVELLGIEIFNGGFDIGENSLQKLLSKLKRYRDKLLRRERRGRCTRETAMQRMIQFADKTFFGKKLNDHEFNWVIHAFPIITRTDSLERLDSYVQDCIRVVGSGKMGNARYRIRYKDMCAAGYRNLVHAYYHGYTLEEVTADACASRHADTGIG